MVCSAALNNVTKYQAVFLAFWHKWVLSNVPQIRDIAVHLNDSPVLFIFVATSMLSATTRVLQQTVDMEKT